MGRNNGRWQLPIGVFHSLGILGFESELWVVQSAIRRIVPFKTAVQTHNRFCTPMAKCVDTASGKE